MKKRLFSLVWFIAIVTMLTACNTSPEPTDNPATPSPDISVPSPDASETLSDNDDLTLNLTYTQFVERFTNEMSESIDDFKSLGYELNLKAPIWDGKTDNIEWKLYGDVLTCIIGVRPDTGELTDLAFFTSFNENFENDLMIEIRRMAMMDCQAKIIKSADNSIPSNEIGHFVLALNDDYIVLNHIYYAVLPVEATGHIMLIVRPVNDPDTNLPSSENGGVSQDAPNNPVTPSTLVPSRLDILRSKIDKWAEEGLDMGAAFAEGYTQEEIDTALLLDEYSGARYDYCLYVFHDVDTNGTDELLVRYSDGMDEYTKLYTYANDSINEIGEFWSRNRLLLNEDGNIYSIGSNGASNTILEIKRISNDGTALVTTETWEVNGPIYTHTSPSGNEVISASEFEAVSDKFFNITTDFVDSLDWKSLT